MRKIQTTKREIKCKTCSKVFTTYPSRMNTRKYCSRECATEDNYGFKPKTKACVICGTDFTIRTAIRSSKKTCSTECNYELTRQTTKISCERRKKKVVERTCKQCSTRFKGNGLYVNHFCTLECQHTFMSENRKEKKNPNYRNGKYTHANFQNRKSKTAYKHLNECRRYRKQFIKKHEYVFCEVCKVNAMGTARHEVHHIYFASKCPKHPALHNDRNLILVCIECHYKFHAGKEYDHIFKKLEKDRKLKELFKP